MTWHPEAEPSAHEKFKANMQRMEIIGYDQRLTCGADECRTKHKFVDSYQCFYCKIWFCDHCAKEHFGKENHATS